MVDIGGSSLVVGTTPISNGNDGYILKQTSGKLDEIIASYTNTGSSVVLRDSAGNAAFNNVISTIIQTNATGQTIAMTNGSGGGQETYGTGNVTFNLPDATYLYQGESYYFNNNATGTITIYKHDGTTLVGTVTSGGYAKVDCDNNSTVNGVWDIHYYIASGGNSSQFVKGDGSLDSSTYLTTSSASSTYVPYTGATSDVNLGTHNLTTTGYIVASGTGNKFDTVSLDPGGIPYPPTTAPAIEIVNNAGGVSNAGGIIFHSYYDNDGSVYLPPVLFNQTGLLTTLQNGTTSGFAVKYIKGSTSSYTLIGTNDYTNAGGTQGYSIITNEIYGSSGLDLTKGISFTIGQLGGTYGVNWFQPLVLTTAGATVTGNLTTTGNLTVGGGATSLSAIYAGTTPDTALVFPLQISGYSSIVRNGIIMRDISTTFGDWSGLYGSEPGVIDTNTTGLIGQTSSGFGGIGFTSFMNGLDSNALPAVLFSAWVNSTTMTAGAAGIQFRVGKHSASSGTSQPFADTDWFANFVNFGRGGVSNVLQILGDGSLVSNGNLTTTGDIKGATYHVGTDAGIDATVTYVDTLLGAKTLTFKKGILTAQT